MRTYELDLMGLVVDCPFGHSLPDCPLKSLRRLPLRERIRLVKIMPQTKAIKIINHHRNCLNVRERRHRKRIPATSPKSSR